MHRDIKLISKHLTQMLEHSVPDLLVRDIDTQLYERLRKAADAQGKSLSQTARETLAEKFASSKEELWEKADRIRAEIREKFGTASEDSTQIIREWRDNDEPYR